MYSKQIFNWEPIIKKQPVGKFIVDKYEGNLSGSAVGLFIHSPIESNKSMEYVVIFEPRITGYNPEQKYSVLVRDEFPVNVIVNYNPFIPLNKKIEIDFAKELIPIFKQSILEMLMAYDRSKVSHRIAKDVHFPIPTEEHMLNCLMGGGIMQRPKDN